MSVSIDKLYRAAVASDLSYVEFGDWPQLPAEAVTLPNATAISNMAGTSRVRMPMP